ncbi:MAG: hypothetical protein GTO20_29480 [Candidatus Aminicenantes bacterium]|nr:hypothetical protein [Candidatus Aminicenantes bacterium]
MQVFFLVSLVVLTGYAKGVGTAAENPKIAKTAVLASKLFVSTCASNNEWPDVSLDVLTGFNFFGKYRGGGSTILINLITGSSFSEEKLRKVRVPEKNQRQRKIINANWHFVEKYLSEVKSMPFFGGKFIESRQGKK